MYGVRPRDMVWIACLLAACEVRVDEAPAAATESAVALERAVEPVMSACDSAFAAAAAVSRMADRVEDLDPAILVCSTIREWNLSARHYPAALDGVDTEIFLSNRCTFGAISAPLCDACNPDNDPLLIGCADR